MPELTAAALAAILDPEHKVQGWWCTSLCEGCSAVCYFGPDTLHTAREHAWRMEDWLEAQGCSYARESLHRRTLPRDKREFLTTVWQPRISPDMRDGMRKIVSQDTNHAGALRAAVERISNGQ